MGETEHQKRVVVVGAGFGGLNAAKRLCGHGFDILLVDRQLTRPVRLFGRRPTRAAAASAASALAVVLSASALDALGHSA